MEIYNIQNHQERNKALELCKNLLEKQMLIPVIGAGFSYETQTDNNGAIPSADQLKETLYDFIKLHSGYEESELTEIGRKNLADLSPIFWSIFDRIPKDKLESFFDYIHKNFVDITCRKGFQDEFLRIRWPYLFTLNYDSLIEDSRKGYYPVIPYASINHYYSREKAKLYKLHGDAKEYLDTGDNKYLILSRAQYIESLMSDDNRDMLNELLTAFSSKSILFLGCGLSEELDLLYSSQLAIKEKVKSIDPNHQAIIYISFESEESATLPLSLMKQDQLSQYGITHVFRVFSENESEKFFDDLAEISVTIPKPGVEAFLEKYSAVRYEQLEPNDTKSRDYLVQENLIWKSFDTHTVTLPGYYVGRTEASKVIDFVAGNDPLCFVSGSYFSGKTMLLLDIAKHFSSKKVYLFPSGTDIPDENLDTLLQKENAVFCFDAKSLKVAQIKKISVASELDKIKKNRSHAIIVVDSSDAPMYKYIFEARNTYREFELFNVDSSFDVLEEPEFNKKIGMISLPPYSRGETLLDYIVRNEKDLINDTGIDDYFLRPQNDLLAKNTKKRIKALIMLATEIRIPAKRAIVFGIDEAIHEMIRCCSQSKPVFVIDRDYSMYSGEASGFAFICNSKYWIIRALSIFAKAQITNIDVIAEAYFDIIHDYRSIYKDDDVKFYQECEPYYYFDHIQLLFNYRWFPNSTKLLNAIYDKLLPILANSFQFLHQKAKGKLVIAQIQLKNKNNNDGKNNLKEAVYNITRAIELAKMYPKAKNIDETILHMVYTQGRILIQYSCVSKKYVPQAVEICSKLYEIQDHIRDDAYDFTSGRGSDKRAFESFKRILATDLSIRNFNDLNIEKAENLLSRWTGKKFVILRKKRKNG